MMSWSLSIRNGDLVNTGSGFGTATGGGKLVQDLRCAILEPMGNDSMHPTYGSLIDGGVDSDGVTRNGVIGETNDQRAALMIRTELQRIVKVYQGQQLARNRGDLAIYNRSTLSADEALLALAEMTLQQVQDQILVRATLQTGTNNLPFSQILK